MQISDRFRILGIVIIPPALALNIPAWLSLSLIFGGLLMIWGADLLDEVR